MTEAERYMKRGWPVFPVRGKIPITAHGVLDATTDVEAEATWPTPSTGLGLATGEPSGVWVLDLDSADAMRAFIALQDKHETGRIRTVAAKTKRGHHLYFRMPPGRDIRNSAGKVGPGIDVRGTGGYVVLPPSAHPDGGVYEWVRDRSPDDFPVAVTPRWLVDLVCGRADTRTNAPALGEVIGEGGRNATLTSLAGTLRRRGMSEEAIAAALHVENEARCVPPLSVGEVDGIVASVARYTPSDPVVIVTGERTEPTMELIDGAVLDRMRDEKLKPVSAVSLPWPKWRDACRGAGGGEGLAHGWHVIVGAPSAAGKSLFATNFAAHAVRTGEHVCMISLEMSQIEIMTRMLAIYSGENIRALEHGRQFDRAVWDAAAMQLQEAPGSIRVNRYPINGLHQIREVFERHINDGCRTFVTDYLQLAWVKSAETLNQQITEVSHTIRGLALEYGVLSLGLSQVNRATSTSNEMTKEGLMGGSSLENDADQVVLLAKSEPTYGGYKSHVKLAKNRHGPSAEWDIILETKTLRMTG